MPTQLTAAEALNQLDQYNSLEGLQQLASQVSGKVIGAATDAEHFLYSYNLHADGSGVGAVDVVKGSLNGTNRVWIEQSEVGKFLLDQTFIDKVALLTGYPVGSTELRGVLFGQADNINGTRFDGFWDIASESYVKDSNGVFNVVAPHAGSGTTFALTEAPAIIERVEAGQRVEIRGGAGNLTDMIDNVKSTGGNVQEAVVEYLKMASAKAAESMDYVTEGSAVKVSTLIDDAQGVITTGASNPKHFGPVAAAIGAMFVATEAGAAYQKGDTQKANDIVRDYLAGTAGDFVAEATFAGMAAAGVAALALVGVSVSAPIAALIGIVAAIGGAIWYGDDAKQAILDIVNDTSNKLDKDNISQVVNRARRDAMEGPSPTTEATPQNPNIFNLNTDPVNLKPNTQPIGSTSGGQGSLGSGPGYEYTMNSQYVNEGGISNVGPSDMATGNIRPGNQSLNTLQNQINDVRQTWYNNGQQSASIEQDLSIDVSGGGPNFIYPTNLPNTRIYGVYRYNDNGDVIGMRLASGQQYTDDKGVVRVSDGNVYLQFNHTSTDENGILTIESATYRRIDGDGKILSQKESLTNPGKTPYTDPLVLDGGGNGVSFSATPVNFDYDADGVAEALSWTATTDPLLVLDRNGDGRINNGSELVDLTGDAAPISLFGLDSNGDKKLNTNDSAFSLLQIWTDRNQDGYASSQEVRALSELGIVNIDLDPAHIQTDTINGKIVRGVTATYQDGSTKILWDVPFATAGSASNPVNVATYNANVDKISSNGQIALRAMSSRGVNLNLTGSGATQAIGSDGNDTLTGSVGDDWLIGGVGSDKFVAGDGADLLVIDANDNLQNIDAGAGIDTVIIADDRGVFLNLAQTKIEVVYGGYGDDVIVGGGSDNYFIDGADGDDLIVGGNVDDVLSGADGEDIIQGGKGDDLIRGGRDSDQLSGGEGNDVLDGGLGNDIVNGESGNDVIVGSGGQDRVYGGSGTDLIQLRGSLEDYKFELKKNFDTGRTSSRYANVWIITDTKKLDGSSVDFSKGEVSDRDGIQTLIDVEKFSYMRGNVPTTFSFNMVAPLPVNDVIQNVDTTQIIKIPVSTLLNNDLDFVKINKDYNLVKRINWVGDAVGGSVKVVGDFVEFTPNQQYKGSFEFTYKAQDLVQNVPGIEFINAPIIADVSNPAFMGEVKSKVVLLPTSSIGSVSDPEYSKQWYLGAINVQTAWEAGFTGKNIDVLVLEPSGSFATSLQVADLNNEEFIGRVNEDFIDTVIHSIHATGVAGVIGAGKNGIGSVGVAYDSTLNSIAFLDGSNSSISAFRKVMSQMRDYDVVNNSWRIEDPHWQNKVFGSAVASAIEDAATSGRQGLGTIMVYGAGNDRSKGYDASLSRLTSNSYTITVGAINRASDFATSGQNTPFSTRGTSILVSAPGSNIVSTAVQVTTADGHTIGTNISEVQGTSYAAPIVSGVVALMLEANPKLSYRDVQQILAVTARKDYSNTAQSDTVWSKNADSEWNGVGMHFSHDFGFGMVDAAAAVRMAQSWQTSYGVEQSSSNSAFGSQLQDNGQQILSFNIADSIEIEHVMLDLKIGHERWSDLVVTLKSPSGTQSILLDRPGFSNGKIYLENPANETLFNQEVMSVHFRGENSLGTWQLIIEDKAVGKAGTSEISASIEILGSNGEALKKYFLTDEYSGGWTLNPTQTVNTELNASALSKNARIDLSGATSSTVNTFAFYVSSGIDKLIAGSGNDTLIGGSGNETIFGAQGNDSIDGGAGHDNLVGGVGNDNLYGGNGQDLLVGGNGLDNLWGGAEADVFLIEPTGSNSVTTIKDFSLTQNDTLIIRGNNLSLQNINQSVAGSKLTLSFTTAAGLNTIILEGITSVLSSENLRVISDNEDVSVSMETGAYLGKNVIYISPIIKIIEVMPKAIESFIDDGSNAYKFESFESVVLPSNYRLVHVSERSVQASPGQQIVIQSSLGYIVLPPDILEANWSSMNSSGGLNFLVQTRYSNNGQISYTFDQVGNTRGSDTSEEIRIGAPVKSSDTSQELWERFEGTLQGYQIDPMRGMSGEGGNDVIYGNAIAQRIYGGLGNDTLYGEGGDDSLWGGFDADVFVFSNGHGSDSIEDLNDVDTLAFNGISEAGVSYSATFSSKSIDSFDVNISVSTGGGNKISIPRRVS